MAAPMRFASLHRAVKLSNPLHVFYRQSTGTPTLCRQQTSNISSLSKVFRNNSNSSVTAKRVVLFATGVSLTAVSASVILKLRTHGEEISTALSLPTVSAATDIKSTVPQYKPSRSIRSSNDITGLKLVLFQYQTCPFCCKVRSYLDYRGLSYDVVEVNSVSRKQIKWSQYKKVPTLVCYGMGEDGYLQMRDSSVIISSLETFLQDKTQPMDKILTFYPSIETENSRGKKVLEFPNKYFIMFQDNQDRQSTPELRKEERNWRKWTDDVLVHTLSPNIYRTPSEAVQSFKYFSHVGEWEKTFSTPERLMVIYVGAAAMFFVGKLLKKRYQLKDDVRQSLYDCCNEWNEAISKKGKYMGGSQPNLADLSVYGVLSAIEGCGTFSELLENTKTARWYYDTKKVIESRAGLRCDNLQISAAQPVQNPA